MPDLAEYAKRREMIATLPRVKFVCERDWVRGFDAWRLGVLWAKDLNAGFGDLAYSRWLTIVMRFRLRLFIDRSR